MGGSNFFSLLDQSKAYHQLQLDRNSRETVGSTQHLSPLRGSMSVCRYLWLDECTSLFPAVYRTLHERISRSVYSTILGWPTNLFSNFWATLRAATISTSETKETWHQSQDIQMSSMQTSNFISWLNHIICRFYSWPQEHHSCVIKIEEETIIYHRAAKYTRISGIF